MRVRDVRGLRGEAFTVPWITWAQQQKATRARLWLTETQEGARRLYAEFGFMPTGAKQSHRIHPAVHMVEMVRALPGGSGVSFVREALAFYFRFHAEWDGFHGAYIHDAMAVAIALDPGLVRSEPLTVDVETLFNERALPTSLTPNRDLGVQLHGELFNGRVSYAAGLFNGSGDAVEYSTNTTVKLQQKIGATAPMIVANKYGFTISGFMMQGFSDRNQSGYRTVTSWVNRRTFNFSGGSPPSTRSSPSGRRVCPRSGQRGASPPAVADRSG